MEGYWDTGEMYLILSLLQKHTHTHLSEKAKSWITVVGVLN